MLSFFLIAKIAFKKTGTTFSPSRFTLQPGKARELFLQLQVQSL
jgi:hypothetical protein